MNAILRHLKGNKTIYAVLLLFFIAKLLTIPKYKTVWWDSAVYIGMGKYIYSFGNSGLWESPRPIIWPLMLGFLWKIGLSPIFFGRVLEILFGSLCILVAYLIGKKLFSQKIAFLSSIFLALSPTFFFFSGVMLTEIVSTFFSLAAVYFFIDKKYFSSGLLFGMAFMARFLQLLAFASVFLAVLFYHKKSKNSILKLCAGFVLIIMPFLILNQILYNKALFPFLQQIYLSKNTGWLNYHPISYYFIELFKENFLFLFFILGLILLFKKININKSSIAFSFILFFIFFNLLRQKEIRFLIVLLPFMYLLLSFSIFIILDRIKKNLKFVIIAILIASFVFSFFNLSQYHKNEAVKYNKYFNLQEQLAETNPNAKIWTSSPILAISSDNKIDKLMYYPIFNKEKKAELAEELYNPDFIFLDSCDLACRPNDSECESDKDNLMKIFRKELKTIFMSNVNGCEQFVFQRIIS